MKLQEILYNVSAGTEIKCVLGSEKVLAGAKGPAGYGLSKSHSARGDQSAKISRVAVLLDRILINESVRLAVLNDGLQGYAEYTNSEGEVFCAVFDGTTTRWLERRIPESRNAALAPIFAYALGNSEEASNLFVNAISFYETLKGVQKEDVYRLCDAFYFDFAKLYNSTEITPDGTLLSQELSQLNRTSNIQDYTNKGFVCLHEKKSTASTPATDNAPIWDEIKAGEKVIGYDWTAEQMKKIPSTSFLDKFVPTSDFFDLLDNINDCANAVLYDINSGIGEIDAIKNHYVNSILVGKPGTGKTSIAYALGAALGIPVYTVTNSRNTEEDNYEGMNKVVDGKITFCETPFLEAYKNGGIIVLEEFNLVAPDVLMGAIGQAVEAPFILMENGYKEVHRHPLCFILATMNTCTQGSKEPNEAFTSRFPDVFLIDDPKKDDFIKILMSGGYEADEASEVYSAYDSIISYLNENSYEDIAMSITLRHCLAALKAIKKGIPFKSAIKRTMVNAIGIKDIALANEVYETVVELLVKRR